MCTLVFYFANRNRSKFKFELNSNEFVNYKVFQILEFFSILSIVLGRIFFSFLNQPGRPPSLFSLAARSRGPVRPSGQHEHMPDSSSL
jgi:hypothetical protein